MKSKLLFILIPTLLILIIGCTKDPKSPQVDILRTSYVTFDMMGLYLIISYDGGSSVTEFGYVWNTEPNVCLENNKDFYIADSEYSYLFIEPQGFEHDTEYYMRAFAKNNYGVGYSKELNIKTKDFIGKECDCGRYVTDIEKNKYPIVKIGDQCWMAQNLRTTKYNDGQTIDNIIDRQSWDNAKSGAYRYNSGENVNKTKIFGLIYNGRAASSGKLCPVGWKVPTDEDWQILEKELGMSDDDLGRNGYRGTNQGSMLAGVSELWDEGALKESNSFGASGFNAVPNGYNHWEDVNIFAQENFNFARFWSKTASSATSQRYRELIMHDPRINRRVTQKRNGLSVRCVKK